jgi:hypothetical protein
MLRLSRQSRSGIERAILCEGFRELDTGGDSFTALQNLPEVQIHFPPPPSLE